MIDLFGNKKPVAIEIDEWWFNGRIIQKQHHFRLPTWISFSDDDNSFFVAIHSSKSKATLFALRHPCLHPKNLPHNHVGEIE